MKYLLIVSLILTFSLSRAQENDFQLWVDLEVEKELDNGFAVSINNEKRFYENVSLYGRNKTDFGLSYDINDELALSASYRLNYYYLFTDITSFKSRWVSSLHYSPRYKRWRFNVRLRISNDSETLTPGWFEQRVIHRERFRVRYNFRRSPFRVQASFETYFPISATPFELMKTRTSAGLQIQVSNNHRYELLYIMEQEYNQSNPMSLYGFMVGYRYRF